MNNMFDFMFLTEIIDIIENDNYKYFMDKDVNDCLLKMYICLLTEDSDKELDNRFKIFKDKYDSLDLERQEYIKKDYLNIINSQEKKILKKERNDKYE